MAHFGTTRIGKALRLVLARDCQDARIAQARRLLPPRPAAIHGDARRLRVAVQCVDDPFYYALFRA